MRVLLFLGIVPTAIAMTAGMAHLFSLPNKAEPAADDHLIVQQSYRGWALLGIVIGAALVSVPPSENRRGAVPAGRRSAP